ncbi:MAG: hypothetical protein HYZ45_05980 [Burkholderiales bacterium]|nr:hypothetical protein [Burkholderiales bacterium]
MSKVEIYADGACKGNPGKGGWGALLRVAGHEKEIFGGEANTTNNRMELMAVIKVRGHSGNAGNERADSLANRGVAMN